MEGKAAWSSAHLRRLVARLESLDGIDRFALVLMALGAILVVWGSVLAPPSSLSDAVARNAHDWAPGLVIDGVLLWVVNSVLRRHERKRVLAQMGSLSREFALDATRRAREERWLMDGSLAGRTLSRASLSDADLSHAAMPRADLSFADFRGATLAYADLRGANMTGANLAAADLRWADLRGAMLAWADLRGALIEGARLDGVDARFASVDARHVAEPALTGAIEGGFLDDDQIAEVRRTFELVAALGVAPIETFYQRLFEVAPHLRHMFHGDPTRQARKLLQSLKVIVSALHNPARHVVVLQSLGARHQGYGVKREHYDIVGDVLLSTLADSLGPEFTPAARAAWARAFELMTTLMTGETGEPAREPEVRLAVPA